MITPPTPIIPPTNYGFSSPQITVTIYPQSGTAITLNGGNSGILAAVINKNIRNRNGGSFSIQLAPGGPNGVNDPNTWTNLINVNSFITISLSRGGSARTVMLGIVTDIKETQIWDNKVVSRLIQLEGNDFTYYFSTFSYYLLSYLGLVQSQSPVGAAGYILGQFSKQFVGPPHEEAYLWLKYVMLGVGSTTAPAVLENTYVFYNGNKVFLKDLFGYWFEQFIENNTTVFVPFLTDIVNSEGNWIDKFLATLPWPYYEFFITTAETGDYPTIGAVITPSATPGIVNNPVGNLASSAVTTIQIPGYNSVSPIVIGRVNPLPWITYPAIGSGATSVFLTRDRWDSLPIYSLGGFSFIKSEIKYSADEVFNFFGVNTVDTAAIAESVNAGSSNLFAFELLGGIIDHYSINTYGFRPNFINIRWLTSLNPLVSSGSGYNLTLLSNTLLGKLASYYIPSANMLNGMVTFPMWPDVLPGNRFIYNPFKNTDIYMFYIEGVTHTYEFGADSFTTLNVARGLKKSDYDSNTILANLLVDNITRINGVLTTRSDTSTNSGGGYINPLIVAKLGIAKSPYSDLNPAVVVPSAPTTTH